MLQTTETSVERPADFPPKESETDMNDSEAREHPAGSATHEVRLAGNPQAVPPAAPAIDRWKAHRDACELCTANPFAFCDRGHRMLVEAESDLAHPHG